MAVMAPKAKPRYATFLKNVDINVSGTVVGNYRKFP